MAAAMAFFALVLLHAWSPEFDPSWRMISEYAYGRASPLLTLLFFGWAASAGCVVVALARTLGGGWARVGLGLLAISGAGALMGGLFDVRHELHGAAFALGVPTLPIAALILSRLLWRRVPAARGPLLATLLGTWIGLALQALTLALFVAALARVGAFHPETRAPLTSLPAGVPAVVGYANRLLVAAYLAWLFAVGGAARRLSAPVPSR